MSITPHTPTLAIASRLRELDREEIRHPHGHHERQHDHEAETLLRELQRRARNAWMLVAGTAT